jgi:TP901 family phage tail tape measure protein
MATVNVSANLNFNPRQVEKDAQRALSRVKLKLDERGFTQPLGRITSASSEFQKSLEASNARVVAFAASAGILYKLTQAFDFLLKSTIQVEKQLASINVILGASKKTLNSFGADLFRVAADTGKSFSEVADAAGEFARQGLSMEKTALRTKNAMILSRLAMMESTEAATALTAAINSFSSAALNSSQIVNKLAAVDAAFAVSSKDLAEAIKRSGASAQAAGVSFDELLAIITTIQERTARGGPVIGNSLKTIFTRIQRPEVLDQLHQLNVEVQDLNGTVLPAAQILQKLANQFGNLAQAQQSNTVELVAGVFQVNNLRALLSDLSSGYTQYQKALRISTNATDQANDRNKELNKTLDAQINALKQRATAAAANIGDKTLAPAIGSGIAILDSIGLGEKQTAISKAIDSLGSIVGAEKTGQKIGEGILSGIGSFLAGPGMVMAAGLIGKLLFSFAKFTKEALVEISKISSNTTGIKATEQQLTGVLRTNLHLVEAIENGTMSRVQAEAKIITAMQQQAALQRQILASSAIMAPGVSGASRAITRGKSSGHIPSFSHGFVPSGAAAGEIAGAFASGYTPGRVRSTNISGIGKVVYNSREKVKKFPGLSQPAIIPPAASKAGVRYRKDFQKVHGFTPANSGAIPNPFGQLTSQRMLDDLNRIRLTDVTRMNVGQKQQAGFMRGIPTATGPTATNPSGMRQVVVNKEISARIESTYKKMLQSVESGRMTVEREKKVRELIMKKYKLNDRSLGLLDQAYANEKRAVEKKVAATKAAAVQQQAAANQQQMILSQQQAEARAAKDARTQRFQNRAMLLSFAAPMVSGAVGGMFKKSDQSAEAATHNARADAISGGVGNVLGMGATGFMMGGPKGAVAGAALGLATSAGDVMDSFFTSLPAASKELEIATEKLMVLTSSAQEFTKGLSQLDGAFSGAMSDESGMNVLRSVLTAFTGLLKDSDPKTAKELNDLAEALVKAKAAGKTGISEAEAVQKAVTKAVEEGTKKVTQATLVQKASAFAADPNETTGEAYIRALLGSESTMTGKTGKALTVQEAYVAANPAASLQDLQNMAANMSDASGLVDLVSFLNRDAFKAIDKMAPSTVPTNTGFGLSRGMEVGTGGFGSNLAPSDIGISRDNPLGGQTSIAQARALYEPLKKIFDPESGQIRLERTLQEGKKNAKKVEKMTTDELKKALKAIEESYRSLLEGKIQGLKLADQVLKVSSARFQGQSAGVIGLAQSTRGERTVARLQYEQSLELARIKEAQANNKFAQKRFGIMQKDTSIVSQALGPFLRDEKRSGSFAPAGAKADQQAVFTRIENTLSSLLTNANLIRDPNDPRYQGSRDQQVKQLTQDLALIQQSELSTRFSAAAEKVFNELEQSNNDMADAAADRKVQEETASQAYINSLNKIRLANEKTFGGGIEGFMSGPSAISRGMTFAGNQAAMSGRAVTSRRRGQAALQNLEAMSEISRITKGGFQPDPTTQTILRDSLVKHYDQMTRGMGMQFTKGDLSTIAQSQIDQRLRPDKDDIQLPLVENMNGILDQIYKDGLKVNDSSINALSNSIVSAMEKAKDKGKESAYEKRMRELAEKSKNLGIHGGSVKELGFRSRTNDEIRESLSGGRGLGVPRSINTKSVNARPSILKAGAEGFFTGGIEDKDFHSQIANFGGLMSELGQDLRVGFKGALKEAIFEAESFSDALRSMAVSILDNLADKIFSKSFDALFNAIGAYATRGAKGGYVGANGIQRFAEGGMVRGGSGFRDDVPAMLSRGEFVVRKSAVDKYGSGFLNTLNMQGGGAVLSASNRIIANDPKRPTDFRYAFSPNLSSLAITDESRPDVKRRRDLADKIFRNRAQHTAAMNAYKQQQRGRLIQAYVSAAMQFAAYGMTHGQTGDGSLTVTPKADRPHGGMPQYPMNLGGSVRSYASGGYVDDVPAMLMGGEMVMNRDAVNKHGRAFFEKLNRGSLDEEIGFSRGGMVGGYSTGGSSGSSSSVVQLFDRLITSNESLASVIEESNKSGGAAGTASSANNNVTININVDKSGVKSDANASSSSSSDGSTSSGGMKSEEEKASTMAEEIRTACLDVIINEKRPGGALSEFGIAGR